MTIKKTMYNGHIIAIIDSDQPVITDTASALDLVMSVRYETQTDLVAIRKEAVAESFFILSTGLAGDILQKFVNYGIKTALFGDYSSYTSKPLRDFIYESNQGTTVAFVPTEEQAIDKLASMSD